MHNLCRYMQKPCQQVRVGESKSVASTHSCPLHLRPLLLSKYPVLWIWIGYVLPLDSLLLLYLHPFCLPFLNRLSPSSPCNQSTSCISSNKVQRLPKAFLVWTHYIILSVEHLGYTTQCACVVCVCVCVYVCISLITHWR